MYCASCGNPIESSTHFCANCGQPQQTNISQPAPIVPPGHCPNCSAQLADGTIYCSNCGQKVPSRQVHSERISSPAGDTAGQADDTGILSWKMVLLGILSGLLLVGLAIPLVLFLRTRASNLAEDASGDRETNAAALNTATPVPLNNLTNITETPSATAVPTPSFSIVPWDENSPDALYIKTFSECLQQEAPLGCIHTAVVFPIESNVAFGSFWCTSDEQTLADTLRVMTLELNVDGFDIPLDNVYTTVSHDDDMSCSTSKAILLGWSVGEHHIRWTYTFAEDFDDGFGSYPAGSYYSDYQIDVVEQTQAELKEIAASENDQVEPPDGTSTDILLQDDFSNPDSGWEVNEYDKDSIGYDSGHYFVIASHRGLVMWGLAYRTFSDVIIEVDTTQVSAPANDNNGYGVFCRVQADDDGYAFFISGDEYYSIQKIMDGDYEILVDWTSSDVITQGNAGNHLRVICDGPDLALFVNGERLATATDSTYTTGDIAFAAATYEEDSFTEIHFDNVVVREP